MENIHDDIKELFADADIPVLRALYARDQGLIVLSFHIVTPSIEAIQIFDYSRKLLPYAALGEVYYVDRNNELTVGQDAHLHYEADVENHYVNRLEEVQKAEEEYHPDSPVTLAIQYPLYAAGHPLAKEQDAAYRRKIALFKGKKIQ